MKEIIYLDTSLINSLLAQVNSGLVTKLVSETSESDSNTENGGATETSTAAAGINAILRGDTSHSTTNIDSYSIVFSRSNRNLIESALDDYSLDVLLDSIKDRLKSEDYAVGDFVLINDVLHSYNFKTLINGIELKGIGSQLEGYEEFQNDRRKFDKLSEKEKHLDKNKQLINRVTSSSWNNFYNAKIMAEYMDSLFPDMTLIKIADTLSICENKLIRLNPAIMNFNNLGGRNANVLGIVTSKFTEKVPSDFTNAKESDALYRNAPSIFSNIILGSNHIINRDDFVVRPIAIYYQN
ncbi:TPA: hypothetical protein ACGOY9_000521 [Streptococcus suis]|nr:hypothetical protein [Streptococcus suis]HEM6362068.1 hypothetical protein [Streptococcus suis]HEM6401962.1 hypothetical protein [Streptococcus suis]